LPKACGSLSSRGNTPGVEDLQLGPLNAADALGGVAPPSEPEEQ